MSEVGKLGEVELLNERMEVLLRMVDVMKMVALARSTIYLKIKNKQFPQSVRVGERGKRWRLSDVQHWVKQCS